MGIQACGIRQLRRSCCRYARGTNAKASRYINEHCAGTPIRKHSVLREIHRRTRTFQSDGGIGKIRCRHVQRAPLLGERLEDDEKFAIT